jgi:hypothetical protein
MLLLPSATHKVTRATISAQKYLYANDFRYFHVFASEYKRCRMVFMPAETIESLTQQELQSFITRLEQAVAVLRASQEIFRGSDQNWVFRKRSLELGLDRIEAAIPEFQRSANAKMAGQPYGPDTQKGRAPKKMAKKAVTKKKSPGKKRG